jgi:mono/diheme cytochrome c family protein
MARILFVGLLFLVVLVGLGVGYFFFRFPDVGPAPAIRVEATPERLTRGAYLANHVTLCTDCHAHRDWDQFAGPIVPGTEGAGGERFDEAMGFPGDIHAPNITPAALGGWTDGEIIRAITSGVSRDGTALFPVMPYPSYRLMTEEDVYSVTAYLRTLPSVEHAVPERKLHFPVNLLVRTMPAEWTPSAPISPNDRLAYGRYLATIAECAFCHTPMEGGRRVEGMDLAGGFEFQMPSGLVRSPNLTPDVETGIGSWTEEAFIARFKIYDGPDGQRITAEEAGFNTPMPWIQYAGMTEEDLGAIFTYLRSVKPIRNRVITVE